MTPRTAFNILKLSATRIYLYLLISFSYQYFFVVICFYLKKQLDIVKEKTEKKGKFVLFENESEKGYLRKISDSLSNTAPFYSDLSSGDCLFHEVRLYNNQGIVRLRDDVNFHRTRGKGGLNPALSLRIFNLIHF